MPSQLAQFQPRGQPFEAAVSAYRGARPSACLSLLRGHVSVEAVLLRARAALRVGQPALGIDTLGAIDESGLSNRRRAEVLILRGALQTRLRHFGAARETLDYARVLALGSASAALEAEFHYYNALWFFGTSHFDEADRSCETAGNVVPALYDVGGYFVPLAISRGRALLVRGLICAARGRYRRQVEYNRAAIAALRLAEISDLWISASFLEHLAFNVRDLDLVDDAAVLRGEMTHAQAWPDELAPMRFEIHRSLGWSSALRGNHLDAFREFREMVQFATTPAHRVLASVERAHLARELGERHSAREEIEHASMLAESVDWNDVGEERIGLAQLAQEVASFDASRAMKLFYRYRQLKAKLAPNMLANVNPSLRAYESLAEGTVLQANGSAPAAVQRFMEAFETWNDIGYRWRAATAALPLAELLNSRRFGDYVRREAALRPNSWLARRAGTLGDAAPAGDEPRMRVTNLRVLRR